MVETLCPINNGIDHLSAGAGFLPSTVCLCQKWTSTGVESRSSALSRDGDSTPLAYSIKNESESWQLPKPWASLWTTICGMHTCSRNFIFCQDLLWAFWTRDPRLGSDCWLFRSIPSHGKSDNLPSCSSLWPWHPLNSSFPGPIPTTLSSLRILIQIPWHPKNE